MSFQLPATIEPAVLRYAESSHITEDEAIIRLIEAGLKASHAGFDSRTAPGNEADYRGDTSSRAMASATDRRGPRAPVDPRDAESILGMFAGNEGFREAIDAVIASREQRGGA